MEGFTDIKTYRIDNAKVIAKWAPIMDALKVTDEKLREFMSIYAEYYMFEQKYSPGEDHTGPFGARENLLPVSLKILSILNLTGKTIEIKYGDDVEEYTYGITMTNAEMDDIRSATGMDIVQKMEKRILDTIVNNINKQLETKNIIFIDKMIESLSLLASKDFPAKMYIKCSYKII